MIDEQLAIDTAPLSNEQGVARALEQIARITESTWGADYDDKIDTMHLRRQDAGPAISYFSEHMPGFVFRLDIQTGELTGIDLERFRSEMVPAVPALRDVWKVMQRARVAARFPGLRTLARFALEGAGTRTREQVRARYCLNP